MVMTVSIENKFHTLVNLLPYDIILIPFNKARIHWMLMVLNIHTLFMSYNALSNVNIYRLWTLLRVNLSFMIPVAIEMIMYTNWNTGRIQHLIL